MNRKISAKYITITGSPGSGKSTLLKFIQKEFNCLPIFEKVESNPYVDLFYLNKSLWSYHLSSFYLLDAIETIISIKYNDIYGRLFCQDYEFQTHFEVYCKFLKSENLLTENDFQLCSKLHSIMLKEYLTPDLIIYLFSNPFTLMTRLCSRNRLNEALSFDEEYLKKLSIFFDNWISHSPYNVFKIDTTEMNLTASENDKKYISKIIQDVINQ